MTSRERPWGVARMEEDLPAVRTLLLTGLSDEAGQAILKTPGLSGDAVQVTTLMERYSGNPLALKLVARTIQDLFDGDLSAFLGDEAPVFDDIRAILEQQFTRLAPLEREILIWLAVEREAIPLEALAQNLVRKVTRRDLVEALRALQRRSLLEKRPTGFTLQNVVTEFLTDYLVGQVCQEITEDMETRRQGGGATGAANLSLSLSFLNHFALLKAQAKETVRHSQVRLILQPIASQLGNRLGKTALLERVQQILATLRAGAAPLAPGYAGGNLLNLLLHLGVDVARLDFSQISVRQVYLRGRYVPGLNLTGADLTGAAFTYIFGNIHGLRFRPQGELLVFGSSEGMMRLWQASDGALLYATPLLDPAYLFIFMDDDSQVVAMSRGNHVLVVVDVTSARLLHTFSRHHSPIWRVVFSRGSQWAASGDASGQVYLWATEGGEPMYSLRGHQQPISALAFAPDGSLLASADVAGNICLWQMADGTLRHSFQGHAEEVVMLQFALGGAILASASNDHTVRLWDVQAPTMANPRHLLARHTQPVLWLAVSPNGERLASGGNDNFIVLWDAVGGQALHILADHAAPLNGLAFSQDSGQLAALDTNETISVWDVSSGQRLDSYRIHQGGIQAVAIPPDGRHLLSGGMDWAVYLWDISNPAAARLINRLAGHQQRVMAVAFSSDGSAAVSGDQSGEIRLWNLRDATSRTLRGHKGGIAALDCSPDQRHLVSAGDDGILCVWDLRHAVQTLVLRGHTNCVRCCAFSPASTPGGTPQWVASGSMDRTVRLWDAKSGQLRHTLHRHTNMVQQVRFSPDGATW
ncbi:MAG: WD40 repeat domain-containing protein [Caldilineaceae bacterium]